MPLPNYADNRLVLTGPADEIARFVRECIRTRRVDGPDDTPSLDLDALVPMPPEILATCDGATDELRALARAATGFEDWHDWSTMMWGTKWNTCDFEGGLIEDAVFDCSFTTAWSCPIPALCALAAAYPLLRGAIVASEPGNDWSLIGVFRDGDFDCADGSYDMQMQLLVRGHRLPKPLAASSVEALLALSNDGTSLSAPDVVDRVSMRAFPAVQHMAELVGGELAECVNFERITVGVCERLDTDSLQDLVASAATQGTWCEGHIEFLLAHDRTRTSPRPRAAEDLGCLPAWRRDVGRGRQRRLLR